MTRRPPRNVIRPLTDWHWFNPSGDWYDIWDMVRDLRKAGHTVREQRSKLNLVDSRYVIAFHTEEEAAIWKLSHV
jgi:hypothetical protein